MHNTSVRSTATSPAPRGDRRGRALPRRHRHAAHRADPGEACGGRGPGPGPGESRRLAVLPTARPVSPPASPGAGVWQADSPISSRASADVVPTLRAPPLRPPRRRRQPRRNSSIPPRPCRSSSPPWRGSRHRPSSISVRSSAATCHLLGEELGCRLRVEDVIADVEERTPPPARRSVARLLPHPLQERAWQCRRRPLLGCVRLSREGRRHGAGRRADAAARRRWRAARLLQHHRPTRTRALHEIHGGRSGSLRITHVSGHAGAAAQPAESRHHQDVRDPARLRLVPHEDQHARANTTSPRISPVCKARPARPPMPAPIIALLTDFGRRDAYVGVMKGVILTICPDATLVDLTHDVPAHHVRHGARVLAACAPTISGRHHLRRRRRSGRRFATARDRDRRWPAPLRRA